MQITAQKPVMQGWPMASYVPWRNSTSQWCSYWTCLRFLIWWIIIFFLKSEKPIWGNRYSTQMVWMLPQAKIMQGMHRCWIKSIHKYITKEACTTLILMLSISHLDYSNTLPYRFPNKTTKWYQIIQNICAKLVLGRPKYSSSTQSLNACISYPYNKELPTNRTAHIQIHQQSSPNFLQELITIRKPVQENMQTTLVLYWKYQKTNIKHWQ